MLRSNSKSLENHVVSPEEEKERLQCDWPVIVEFELIGSDARFIGAEACVSQLLLQLSHAGRIISP